MDIIKNISAVLLLVSAGLICAGFFVYVFLPDKIGGSIYWRNKKISSVLAALFLIILGIPLFAFALELSTSYWLRVDYLKKVQYYLYSDRRYIISGGKNKTDRITVDDDLLIQVDNNTVLRDEDGFRCDLKWAIYKGEPVVFYSANPKKLKIKARYITCCSYYLSPLYLHKPDGGVIKLTDGIEFHHPEPAPKKPIVFFDKTYNLT